MMNVLLDNTIFEQHPGGGIARYFNEVIPLVAKKNPDIRFSLVGEDSLLRGCANMSRLRLMDPMTHRPWKLFWRQINSRRLSRFLSRTDLFLSTYYTPKPQGSMKSVVVAYDCIDMDLPCMNPNGYEFIAAQRKVMEEADGIVAISEETKRGILRNTRVDGNRVEVVYPVPGEGFAKAGSGSAIQKFRNTFHLSKPYWLYVGTRTYYKNFDCLLRAFAMMARHSQDELVVVGGEKELTPHLLDFVFRKRLEYRVHLVGRLTDEDLSAAYAGAEGFVYPSFAEGFGIPLLEAMQCGVPVVASDIPVFREVAGEAALYFDPHSPAGLARTMQMLSNKDVRGRLTGAGYTRVQLFAGNKAAAQMADVLRRALGKRI